MNGLWIVLGVLLLSVLMVLAELNRIPEQRKRTDLLLDMAERRRREGPKP